MEDEGMRIERCQKIIVKTLKQVENLAEKYYGYSNLQSRKSVLTHMQNELSVIGKTISEMESFVAFMPENARAPHSSQIKKFRGELNSKRELFFNLEDDYDKNSGDPETPLKSNSPHDVSSYSRSKGLQNYYDLNQQTAQLDRTRKIGFETYSTAELVMGNLKSQTDKLLVADRDAQEVRIKGRVSNKAVRSIERSEFLYKVGLWVIMGMLSILILLILFLKIWN